PAAVAIVAAHDLIVADAQGRFTAVGTMRTNGPDVIHLPRPRLIPIDSTGQSAHRADVDAGSALVAIQVIVLIGNDLRDHAPVADPKRAHAHAFVTHADAAIAKDAARRIEEYDGRPLLLRHVDLALRKAALAGAVAEHHVLELALAALIANRTI